MEEAKIAQYASGDLVLSSVERSAASKAGHLTKRGEVWHSWKRRWFILTQGALLYFKNAMVQQPAGVISLLDCVVQEVPREKFGKRFCFSIRAATSYTGRKLYQGRDYFFVAEDDVKRKEWIEALKTEIKQRAASRANSVNEQQAPGVAAGSTKTDASQSSDSSSNNNNDNNAAEQAGAKEGKPKILEESEESSSSEDVAIGKSGAIRAAASGKGKPVLYHAYRSRSTRVVWLLEELGIDYELRMVNLVAKDADFLKVSPTGKVPVLVDGDVTLFESFAIVTYLAENASSKLLPEPADESRATLFQFAYWAAGSLDPTIFPIALQFALLPEDKRDNDDIEKKARHFHQDLAPVLEKLLEEEGPFLLGASFSILDIMVGFTADVAGQLGFLERHPLLKQYVAALASRPAYQYAKSEPSVLLSGAKRPSANAQDAKKSESAAPVAAEQAQAAPQFELVEAPKTRPMLYHVPGTRSMRVIWLIYELQLDIEIVAINTADGEHKTPEFLKISPSGKLPVLVYGSVVLWESFAIIQFLLEHSGSALLPQDATARAKYFELTYWTASVLDEITIPTVVQQFFVSEENRDQAAIDQNAETFAQASSILETALGEQRYIMGKFSALDVTVGYSLNIADKLHWLQDHPKLLTYLQRLRSRDEFRKAHGKKPNSQKQEEQKRHEEEAVAWTPLPAQQEGEETRPTLYFAPRSRATRVLWLARELGVELDVKVVNLAAGEQKQPEYLKINPNGVVPAFVDGDVKIFESAAICLYLLEKHDSPLLPNDGVLRSRFFELVYYVASTVDDVVIPILMHSAILPEPMRDPNIVAALSTKWANEVLPYLVRFVGDSQFALSDEFSAADVMLGYVLGVANLAKMLEKAPTLQAYMGHIAARPAFQYALQYTGSEGAPQAQEKEEKQEESDDNANVEPESDAKDDAAAKKEGADDAQPVTEAPPQQSDAAKQAEKEQSEAEANVDGNRSVASEPHANESEESEEEQTEEQPQEHASDARNSPPATTSVEEHVTEESEEVAPAERDDEDAAAEATTDDATNDNKQEGEEEDERPDVDDATHDKSNDDGASSSFQKLDADAEIELYYFPKTRAQRALWLIHEMGLSERIKLKRVDLLKGEHMQPEYLAIAPTGKVPYLRVGDFGVSESFAIVQVLCELFDSELLPGVDSAERARHFQLMYFVCSDVDDVVLGAALQLLQPADKRDMELIQTNAKKFVENAVPVLEAALQDNDYMLGAEFSMVDVVVGFVLTVAVQLQWLKDSPKLLTYAGRLSSRDAFKSAYSVE